MASPGEMPAPDESLVARRSKRSTAGNRMEAALAEMALDTLPESLEDDVEFVNDKGNEEDIFASDFESTDEEAAQEEVDAGDKAVQEEDRRARKDARSRLDRATAAAHARQKLTFNPQAEAESSSAAKPKGIKRRVSLGVAVNAETGEVLPVDKSSPRKKRHSQRKHTILNTSAAVERLKKSEEKKAAMPKKTKLKSKTYTQAELIALALDNEEGNIVEHRDYLKVEEEKRRRARVVRTAVEGPLIRWISRGEEIKVVVPAPAAPAYTPARTGFPYMAYGTMGSTPYGQSTPYTYSAGVYPHMYIPGYTVPTTSTATAGPPSRNTEASQQPNQPTQSTTDSTPATATQPTATLQQPATSLPLTPFVQPTTPQPTAGPPAPSTSQSPALPVPSTTSQSPALPALSATSQPTPSTQPTPQIPIKPPAQSSNQTITPQLPTPSQQPPAQTAFYTSTHYNPYMAQLQSMWATQPPAPPIEKMEKFEKNYVVHELAQSDGAPKPQWGETMAAIFGDKVKWDEVKVFVGKNRPLSRPIHTCPITGKPAKYLDPRTGVPFADVRAYDVLTKLLKHEYAWSPSLGRYVGQDGDSGSVPPTGL